MNKVEFRDPVPPIDLAGALPQIQRYLDQNELREAFRKLWRRRNLVFVTILLLSALTFIVLIEMKPRFSGTVALLLDPRQPRVTDVQSVLEGASKDAEAIYSEVDVLMSRQLIGKLVDKLSLQDLPEFNPSLRPP